MTTLSPPSWLSRDVIACHPQRRVIFEPLRLRQLKDENNTLALYYTDQRFFSVFDCRRAEPSDLLRASTTVYLSGKQYAKAVAGEEIRLSAGGREYIIRLQSDASAIAHIAAAFSGKVVPLIDDQIEWINSLFTEPQ